MPETKSLEEFEGTVARLYDDDPQTLRLELQEGETRPEHSHPGKTITLCVVRGIMELRLDNYVHVLEAADVIRFFGERNIQPGAVEDVLALLVFTDSTDE